MTWADRILDGSLMGKDALAELIEDSPEAGALRESLASGWHADELQQHRDVRMLQDAGCKVSEIKAIFGAIAKAHPPRKPAAKVGAPWAYPGKLPAGYVADRTGVYRMAQKGDVQVAELVVHAPVWVSQRLIDVEDGSESWVIQWLEHGRERSLEASRAVAQTARLITGLADKGLPVSSDSASALIRFLEAHTAIEGIPRKYVARRMGWYPKRRFMLGRQCLGGSIEMTAAHDTDAERLMRACEPIGSAEGWLALIPFAERFSSLMASLAASLASPVLVLLGEPGFVVSWDGRTSAGKTTALRVAASVWGSPCDRAGLLPTWDQTDLRLQQWAEMLRHLPLCIDDTRRWRGKPDALSACVYQLTQGQGRGRMVDGRTAQKTATWQLVTLSTGEDPISETSTAGGLRARVLQIWGSPFGGSEREAVDAVSRIVWSHHGHAGRQWVELLQERGSQVIRERADLLKARWGPLGDVGGRLLRHAALVGAVAWTAAEWMGWPIAPERAAELVWQALEPGILDADGQADPSFRAWWDVQSWLASNAPRIDGSGQVDKEPSEWIGGCNNETGEWYVYPHHLRRWAETAGYRLSSLVRDWAADGRLIREDKHMTSKRNVRGQRARMYVLKMTGEAS